MHPIRAAMVDTQMEEIIQFAEFILDCSPRVGAEGNVYRCYL